MIHQISEETKKRTNECPYNLECLDSDNWDTCSIDALLQGILIIKNKCNKNNCSYFILIGDVNYFCKCPIRCDIYKRYRK